MLAEEGAAQPAQPGQLLWCEAVVWSAGGGHERHFHLDPLR